MVREAIGSADVISPRVWVLVAVAPAGLGASYRDLIWSGTPIEHLVLVAARFGIEITGPPVT